MTKFLTGLVYLLTSCTPVFAADRIVEGTSFPGVSYEKNFVKNPEAEKNINNVTVSSAIVTRTTTTPLQGVASFSIDATGSAQTVKFDTSTLDQYLNGQNCEAKFVFTGDASLYKAYVEQSSTKLTADLQLTNETNSKNVSINFPCGTTFTDLRLVIESTSASAAAIKVDKVYLGMATNIGQTQFYVPTTSYTPTLTNFTATVNSATYRIENGIMHLTCTLTIVTGVPTGNLVVGLPSGYTIDTGKIGSTVVSTNLNSAFAFDQSGNLYTGNVVYNTASTITFAGPNTTGRWNASIPFTWAVTDTLSYQASFPVVGAETTQVLKANQTPWYVEANITGASPDLGTSNVASDTEITNASLTMTPKSGSAPVGVSCSSTNSSATPSTSATTCSAGSESLGGTFSIPVTGAYEVCFSYSSQTWTGAQANATINQFFKIVETASNSQTAITTGANITNKQHYNVDGTQNTISITNNNTCEFFNFSAGSKTVRLKYQQSVNAAITSSSIIGTNGVTIRLTVKPVTQNMPMPLLVGSLTSGSTGALRVESAVVVPSATCTISSSSSSWITVNTSHATGDCSVNIIGFSSAPVCTATALAATNTARVSAQLYSISSSVLRFVQLSGNTPTLDNNAVHIVCMGPK